MEAMRRCKGLGEVTEAAEEGGVRMTRAPAAEVRKRKLSGQELSCCSSSVVHVKRHHGIAVTAENSDDPCASPSSDLALSSCSSSNASSDLAKEKLTTLDLQEEDEASSVEIATSAAYNIERRERRETTPSSELQAVTAELESTTVRPSEANSSRRSAAVKMPSDAELEDFFSAAEKDLQRQFAQKYNFDFVKEEPLEGRLTWIQVKP